MSYRDLVVEEVLLGRDVGRYARLVLQVVLVKPDLKGLGRVGDGQLRVVLFVCQTHHTGSHKVCTGIPDKWVLVGLHCLHGRIKRL